MNPRQAKVCVVVALCAFGMGPSDTVRAASPATACALLTQAQVSAALGVPVSPGKNYGVETACQWAYRGASDADTRVVDFAIISPRALDGARMMASMSSAASIAPVRGLGDEAFYFITGPIITLTFRKGGAAYKVYFQHGGSLSVDQIKAQEKTLALHVLEKS